MSASEPGSSDVTSSTWPGSMRNRASRVLTIGIGQKSPRQSIILSATTGIWGYSLENSDIEPGDPSNPSLREVSTGRRSAAGIALVLRGLPARGFATSRYTRYPQAAAPGAGLPPGPQVYASDPDDRLRGNSARLGRLSLTARGVCGQGRLGGAMKRCPACGRVDDRDADLISRRRPLLP